MINLQVGQHKKCYNWLIDSGAPINVVDETSFKSEFTDVSLGEISPEINFKTADGSPLRMIVEPGGTGVISGIPDGMV